MNTFSRMPVTVKITGARGPRGAGALPSQRYDFTAVAGQSRIPATGDLTDDDGKAFATGLNFATLIVNNQVIEPELYNYGGGTNPVLLAGGFVLSAGDAVTVIGQPYAINQTIINPDPGSGGSGDVVNFVELRGDTETDQQAFDRLKAAGYRRFYCKGGGGRTGGKYKIGCEPWTNGDIQNPSSPNYDPNATMDDLIEAPGNLVSGLLIKGDGMGKTVFLQGDSNYGFMGSALGGANIDGVHFEDVTFEGNNPAYTVASQSFHNVALFGVTNATFLRCEFKASPGDGMYLARGPKQTSANHNFNCVIDYCEFNGVNNMNRNPVSHEDCTGLTVTNSYFHHFTRSGEPGGMDIEPVITSATLGTNLFQTGKVVYANNRFKSCNGVMFCLQMDPRLSTDYAGMLIVKDNHVEDCFSFIDVVGPPDDQNDVTRSFGCHVSGNTVRRLTGPVGRLGGALGVRLYDNEFEDCDLLRLGYGWGNRFTFINRNTFTRCGRTNGFVFIANLDCRNVNLDDNTYIDCGRTDGLGTNAILLTQDGADELASSPGTVRARTMGISFNRSLVFNTRSNGGAGRLTHIAIHNATGGYGPGASNSGTIVNGTPITNGDTFSPPRPRAGKYREIPYANQSIPNGGGVVRVDDGIQGLTPSTRLRAYFNFFIPQGGPSFRSEITLTVTITSSSTFSIDIRNTGTAQQNTGGTGAIIVEEY